MDNNYCKVTKTYASLRPPMQTMLYTPDVPTSGTGILILHSDSDYLSFLPAEELAKRGYFVLCANIAKRVKPLDEKMLDVKRAYTYFREVAPIGKILILGHSGGATLMSAYQSVAENGCAVFQGEEKIYKMPEIEALPPADGVLLLDSNWGNGAMTLLSLDPAVEDETSGRKLNPDYDVCNPDMGYDPNGSQYSKEFIKRYMCAQRTRMTKLVGAAQERLRAINAGEGNYVDDEPFIIPGGEQIGPCNKLFPQDVSLLAHTKKAWPLLHGDGTVTEEVVHSLRQSRPTENLTQSFGRATNVTTVRTFLASSAVLAGEDYFMDESGIYGIDYASSYCCTPGNVRHISVPTLVMGLTAGYEYLASEQVYENLGSKDKTLAFAEGINHPFMVPRELEEYPGQFGDPIKVMFDYVKDWIDCRF
ncbi:MAG: alpha/beta hydrolase [Clostridiales bacterium]|nr:alpha/beta hydrolase [Clostridiales bacterium]